MNLQKYTALVKTVDYGSISKAASDMGYTQSAVSKMIIELEKEWDIKLINRNHDGVEATAACNTILEDIRRILHANDGLETSVSSLHGIDKGTIRLGAPHSISANLLPPVLKNFHDNYPNIKVELFEGEDSKIADYLRRGVLDVCVLPDNLARKFVYRHLSTDCLVAILPENHPLADADGYPSARFETDDVIRLKEVADYDFNRFFDDYNLNPNVVYEVTDDTIMLSMVEAGLGVCVDYELMLKPLRYNVRIKHMDKTRLRKLNICVRSEEDITPLIRLFLDSFGRA